MYFFFLIFFSSLRDDRAAGRWRDEKEEEELEEEVESPEQVDRVCLVLEHESFCQGLCASVHPLVHLPACFCCPSSHFLSSQAKCPKSTSLWVQNLLSSAPFLPLVRETTEWGGVRARQRQDMRIDYFREFTLPLRVSPPHLFFPTSFSLNPRRWPVNLLSVTVPAPIKYGRKKGGSDG